MDSPPKVCASCRHAIFDERVVATWGYRAVGSCRLGGPTPANGCSDIGPNETCERWAEARPANPRTRGDRMTP